MIEIILHRGKGHDVCIEWDKIKLILKKRYAFSVFYIPSRAAVDIIKAVVPVSCVVQPIRTDLASAEAIQFAYIVFHFKILKCVIFINYDAQIIIDNFPK